MRLQETYKTDIPWMPELPSHWKIIKGKNLFTEKSIKNYPNEPLLAASQKQGIVLKKMLEQRSMEALSNFESFKLVEKDDFVISLRSFEGGLEIAHYRGIISPVYNIFNFRENDYQCEKNYFKYLFKSILFIQELNIFKKGIRDGQSINYKEFANILFPLPPKKEQTAIANYLDSQSKKIKHFIQKKQTFIALLKEQRQAVINKAVTKGINPNVKLKNSGIDWLGDIPEHWEVKRLKNVCDIVLGKMLCSEDKGNYSLKPYLKSKNIGWENVILDDVENMWFSDKELLTYRIKENDLLVSEGGEVGKTCIWKNELEECYIQNSVHKLTFFEECLPAYYLFWMGMLGELGYFKSIVNQVSIAHLTRDKIVKVVCLYPQKKEQAQIVSHIKTETAKIDQAITQAQKEIALIKEYKEAMIAEAVVGKLKMPEL